MIASLSSAEFGLEVDPAEAMVDGVGSWLEDGFRRDELPRGGAVEGALETQSLRRSLECSDKEARGPIYSRAGANEAREQGERTQVEPERVNTKS